MEYFRSQFLVFQSMITPRRQEEANQVDEMITEEPDDPRGNGRNQTKIKPSIK